MNGSRKVHAHAGQAGRGKRSWGHRLPELKASPIPRWRRPSLSAEATQLVPAQGRNVPFWRVSSLLGAQTQAAGQGLVKEAHQSHGHRPLPW